MNFKEKVQSMTAKEIIMAMVKALTRPPIINIEMSSYGHVVETTVITKRFFGLYKKSAIKKLCFGCAATNTICQITGKKFTPDNISEPKDRAEFINSDTKFLDRFECAIDMLRRGNIKAYNEEAEIAGIATIEYDHTIEYPYLNNDYTNKDLAAYKQLAEEQLS